MSVFKASSARPVPSHVHSEGERCPVCDQPVTNERMDDIRARAVEREDAQRRAVAERLKAEFQRERAEIEARVKAETQAALAAKLAEAETQRRGLEAQMAALKTDQEAIVAARLAHVQEQAERQRAMAVQAEQAKSFDEKQKLLDKLATLQRQLENKTAQELGEGAEVDLFEMLREAFDGDRIRRVEKGAQGVDIIHEIIHNGRVAGKIVYDAKNRNAWRNDYVTKLRQDQIAERADHAILAARAFPQGAQQLALQEGVIIANPARVKFLAEIFRSHVLRMFELRLGNQEREAKTDALYQFVTSERCAQLFDSAETQTRTMGDLEEAEQRTHRKVWDQRSKLIKSMQKTTGDLRFEIDRIIGTAEEDGTTEE